MSWRDSTIIVPVTACHHVSYDERYSRFISEGKKRLEAGKSIVLYLQSTRSAEFNPKRFNSIGVKLPKEAKVSIIPFALKTDFLANGKWVKDLGPIQRNKKVYFEFGEPIKVSGHGKEEHQKIIEFAQFLAVCRRSKWSKRVTNSPFLALRATVGSNAAYKIISACSNAVN
jgi:1-acyl-sn-glycerol-3-phosphate acyltransferase